MEKLEETLKKYPLIALIILLGAISCLAVASAAPIMTNIANPYMLWLKQGLYYVLGGALSYIIYKVGQDTLYNHIKTLYNVGILELVEEKIKSESLSGKPWNRLQKCSRIFHYDRCPAHI